MHASIHLARVIAHMHAYMLYIRFRLGATPFYFQARISLPTTSGSTYSPANSQSENLATMSVGSRIIANLRERLAYIEAATTMGLDKAEVMQAQSEAVVLMISNQRNLPMAAATDVMREIAAGPWRDHQKRGMQTALATAQSVTATKGGLGNTAQQKCATIEHHFIVAMRDRIRDKSSSWQSRCGFIGACLHAIGITIPGEKILKRCAAIALLEGESDIDSVSAATRQAMAKHIQAAVKSQQAASPYPLGHLQRYPDRPSDLPPAMQSHAYGEGGLPSDWTIPGLDMVAQGMPYRATHASLRSSAPAQTPAFDNSIQQLQFNVMQQFMAQCLRGGSADQQRALTESTAQCLRAKGSGTDKDSAADGVKITLTGGSKLTSPKSQRALSLELSPKAQRAITPGSPSRRISAKASLEDLATSGAVEAQGASSAPPPQVERDAVAAMEASFATALALAKPPKVKAKGKAKGKAKVKATPKAKGKAAKPLALAAVPGAPAAEEEEEEEEEEQAAVAKAKSKAKPVAKATGDKEAGATAATGAKGKAKGTAKGKAKGKAKTKAKSEAAKPLVLADVPGAPAREEEEEVEVLEDATATVAKAKPKAKPAAKAASLAVTDVASGAEAEAAKKRPAAAEAGAMAKKKPAAAEVIEAGATAMPMVVDYSDYLVLTLEQKRATSRGAFTTRAYKGTLTRAKRLGIVGQPQLDWSKAAYARAAAVWDGFGKAGLYAAVD